VGLLFILFQLKITNIGTIIQRWPIFLMLFAKNHPHFCHTTIRNTCKMHIQVLLAEGLFLLLKEVVTTPLEREKGE